MLDDYHIHLEEGPYNAKWLNRTLQSLVHFYPNPHPFFSIEARCFYLPRIQIFSVILLAIHATITWMIIDM